MALQQRALFQILTGFPFNIPQKRDNHHSECKDAAKVWIKKLSPNYL
jgi:hypothetical protein